MSNPFLVGNIPGNSLTVEPGSVPWEQPPKYVTLEETANFYVDSLSDPAVIDEVLGIVKRRRSILSFVDYLIKLGVMKGLHTVHVGFLVTPILVEIIKTFAEVNGIKYYVTDEEKASEGKVNPRIVAELIKEMRQKVKEDPEAVVVEKRGLMSKGE